MVKKRNYVKQVKESRTTIVAECLDRFIKKKHVIYRNIGSLCEAATLGFLDHRLCAARVCRGQGGEGGRIRPVALDRVQGHSGFYSS